MSAGPEMITLAWSKGLHSRPDNGRTIGAVTREIGGVEVVEDRSYDCFSLRVDSGWCIKSGRAAQPAAESFSAPRHGRLERDIRDVAAGHLTLAS